METKQAMSKYRAPAAAKALGKAPHGPAPSNKPAGPAHAGPPLSPLEMNPAERHELHAYNTKQVGENTQAELLPFRQRSAELNNQEQTAANRYGAAAQATQGLLGGIQGEASASARTAQNEAADSALRAAKQIESTGQATAQQNAGYLDPQVKAALGNQQANVTATGQAREAGAAAMSQNEANYLTNVRAAAAQRATEGMQGIASTYGKQRGEVGGQERQALARMPGQISKLDTEGRQKYFTNRATEQGLFGKVEALKQKGQESAAKNRVSTANSERSTATSRGNSERSTATSEANNKRTTAASEANTAARIKAGAEKRTGTASPTTSNKLFSELGLAASQVQKYRSGKGKLTEGAIREAISSGQVKEGYKVKGKSGKMETKIRIAHGKAVGNQVLVNAALEVWNKHEISGATRKQLEGMGYKPGTGAELTQELYNSVPAKTPNRRGARPA